MFDRLTALFGRQVMAAKWGVGPDLEEVLAVWNRALERHEPAMIADALRRVLDGGGEFPPSLPEFVAMIRDVERSRRDVERAERLRLGSDADIAGEECEAVLAWKDALREMTDNFTAMPRERVEMPRVERSERLERRVKAALPEPSRGLPDLLILCAKVEALAGGDEAQALRRLEQRVVMVPA